MVKCPNCKKEESVEFVEGGTDWSPQKYYVCKNCNTGFCKWPDGTVTEMDQRWTNEYIETAEYMEGKSKTDGMNKNSRAKWRLIARDLKGARGDLVQWMHETFPKYGGNKESKTGKRYKKRGIKNLREMKKKVKELESFQGKEEMLGLIDDTIDAVEADVFPNYELNILRSEYLPRNSVTDGLI